MVGGTVAFVLGDLVGQLRARHCAIATAQALDGDLSVLVDPGDDPVDEATLFEIGSITKSITGTLLATQVLRNAASLETSVADVLGTKAPVGAVTLLQLATHTAGLPRLSPNHSEIQSDPSNPYSTFDEAAMLDALPRVELARGTEPEYSNFGFQLLGYLLEVISERPFRDLVVEDVLRPAGCLEPRCGDVSEGDDQIAGYDGGSQVPHWTQPLAGAGGVELSIDDFGRWIMANTFPASSSLEDAVRLAQQVHWGDNKVGRGLGWRHYNGGLIHNGGTGGFRSFCGFVPGVAGVGVLTNLGGWDAIDGAAIGYLTSIARAAAAAVSR